MRFIVLALLACGCGDNAAPLPPDAPNDQCIRHRNGGCINPMDAPSCPPGDGFGATCMATPNQLESPCTSTMGEIGWCVVTEVGATPTCRRSCDSTPCPSGETAIPIAPNNCYCMPPPSTCQ